MLSLFEGKHFHFMDIPILYSPISAGNKLSSNVKMVKII